MAKHVCPIWIGYLLTCPVRRLFQNPEKLLGPFIKEGMTVLDVGCAMGFFSLPVAHMVGPNGKVICIDLQPKMIDVLEKRARKAGLINRIEPRLCAENSLGLKDRAGTVDFAFAIAVVHEVPDTAALFQEIHHVLKPGSRLLVAEPKGHVTVKAFDATVVAARETGFAVLERSKNKYGHTMLLQK
jgi:ubiquinone/menaquinone biosynthesis C-methylase UbiE